jgi:glycosyltransferase involved in cell wall biosynthesis/ubiquinone/menaquinone biosynthesis C-methylase UbiE
MLETITCTSIFVLWYVYDGYLRLLKLMAQGRGVRDDRPLADELPMLTVLLTVHNEADVVAGRVENILACEYAYDRLEVIVASDGSTDGTDQIVRQIADPRVRLVRPEIRGGKSAAQNEAIAQAQGEIIVFTDAGTRFDKNCLAELSSPFSQPEVGGVAGHLLFTTVADDCISTSQGYYWSYELQLRQLEGKLGILAVAAGACMAIRKQLFRPMDPATGEDCILPLDVVAQGFKFSYAANALAYDCMENNWRGELRTRARMTLRNWIGTWSRPALLNPIRRPGYAFALWSHKILRWLSPLFLLCMTIGIATLSLSRDAVLWDFLFAAVAGFYALAVVGAIAQLRGRQVPIAGTAWAFVLANVGFLLGLCQWTVKRRITGYRDTTARQAATHAKTTIADGDPKVAHFMEDSRMTSTTSEEQRILQTYAQRDASGKRDLYRWDRADCRFIEYRKRLSWSRALRKSGFGRLDEIDILDVGCGDGAWLRMMLEWGAAPARLHGIDLLEDRIEAARRKSPMTMNFQCGNSWPLPYADRSMDLVTTSTVFSSILDATSRSHLADEMRRVLKPGGRVIIYDFIISHPRNRSTIGIGRGEIRRMFPTLALQQSYRLTLAPPLSRVLAPWATWLVYFLECALPILCTHRLHVLAWEKTSNAERDAAAVREVA